MNYNILHPDWFYSYLDIPNLEEIKKELVVLFKTGTNKKEVNQIYSNFFSPSVLPYCSELKKYLISVGLEKKFDRVLFSRDLNAEKRTKVHVDSYDPKITSHSLNIALEDYENSYTAWYKTDRIQLRDSSEFGLDPVKNYAYLFLEEAEEIKRLEYHERPVLVNTTILHRGIADKKTRLICGLRFFPELTDDNIKRLGIKTPHIQED